MRPRTALLFLLLTTGAARAQEPVTPAIPGLPLAQAVAWAHQDAVSLPAGIRVRTRYLSAHAVPVDERVKFWQVLNGHIHERTRRAEICLVRSVRGTGGSLLALVLDDYGWPNELWDKLADVEPWFYADTDTVQDWVRDYGHRKEYFKKTVRVRALADWLSVSADHARMKHQLPELLQCRAPIVDAEWFVSRTMIQAGRNGTGYYDFTGIKTEADFHKLIGFDAKLAKGRDYREAVAVSGITQQPRAVSADSTIADGGGKFWRTFDSELAVGRKNPLITLDPADFQAEASEQFGPNGVGMMAYLLVNLKNGKRADSVPDTIARDHTSTSNDGRVHSGLCWRCHASGNSAGINDLDPWARSLFTPPVLLRDAKYERFIELRRLYLRDLTDAIDDSRRVYARAIGRTTGLKPDDWVTAYAKVWRDYEERPWSVERLERVTGVPAAQIRERLVVDLKARQKYPEPQLPTVSAYVHPQFRGLPVRQVEEAFPFLMAALRGVALPYPVPGK